MLRRCLQIGTVMGALSATAAAQLPSARGGAAMAYDAARRHVLLFGGVAPVTSGGVAYPDDLWAWNGSSWRRLDPPPGTPHPSGRDAVQMVYDEARRRTVLFGGRGPESGDADWNSAVWEWDGTRWYRVEYRGRERTLHSAAVYDPVRRRVILFGGGRLTATGGYAGLSRAIWEWDGVSWTPRDTLGPERYAGAIGNTRAGELILMTTPVSPPRDSIPPAASGIWTWNGAWAEREAGPSFNNLQAATSAPDGTLYIYQSWEERWLKEPVMHVRTPGGSWSRIVSDAGPGRRNTQAAAWDSDRKRFVLFGGRLSDKNFLNDTWEFDGRTWARR